ncbi:MAG TPA: hypothetical protein VK465_08365, partial [Fibrobacteria bacterium]|nr:hypothetical protein [Fibrobacteria bacterium]
MQGATPQPTRPWAVPALAALVAVAVTLVALASIRGLESTTHYLVQVSYENQSLSGRVRTYVEIQAGSTRAFLLTQDAAFLDQSRRARGLILSTLDTLEGNRPDADTRAHTARLRRDQARYDAVLRDALAKGLRDAPLRERSSFLLREILPVKAALDSSATALLAHHAEQHAGDMAASERESRRAMLHVLLACGGG